MRETSILYNKNYKMQAHARVCEDNKLEELKLEEKNDTYWNNFAVEGATLKDHIGRVEYQDDILKDDSPYHKGISNILL